jgi:hypothetical protein
LTPFTSADTMRSVQTVSSIHDPSRASAPCVGEFEVVEKAAVPLQQARVLAPQHRLSNGKFAHDLSEPAVVETPSVVA